MKYIIGLFIFVQCSALCAQDSTLALMDFSLQELSELQITIASKKEEKLLQTAAAVYVMTRDEIMRTGATNIPEVLRYIPGFQVASIDANKWAISTRGFIGRFSNKLLVLIDGRTVYTPIFSGVFWSMQDIVLEDIDRIEVIRGPGATLWGANAVNGIINIVTRHASETQGGLIAAYAGSEEKTSAVLRYGGKFSDNNFVRGFAKYSNHDPAVYTDGSRAADGWDVLHGGIRADLGKFPGNPITFQADIYTGRLGHTMNVVRVDPPRMEVFDYRGNMLGWNALLRSQTIFKDASVLTIQSYFDYLYKDEYIVKGRLATFDVDIDYLFDLGSRHQIHFGSGYRNVHHHYDESFVMSISQNVFNQDQISAFLQDDIQLIKNRLRLTVGSKFEHHYYTGFEFQPNIRAAYTPSENHSLWMAVSKAVRTPSVAEVEGRHIAYYDSSTFFSTPVLYGFEGNPDFGSEILYAFEAGYRFCPKSSLLLDISAFYNSYDHLASAKLGSIVPDPSPNTQYIIFYTLSDNKIAGSIYGVEWLLDWHLNRHIRLQLSHTMSQADMHTFGDGTILYVDQVANIEGQIPAHFGFIRTIYNLSNSLNLNIGIRFMDDLPELGIENYVEMDANVIWQVNNQMSINLSAKNLLNSSHLEFIPELYYTLHTMIQRSVYAKVMWSF